VAPSSSFASVSDVLRVRLAVRRCRTGAPAAAALLAACAQVPPTTVVLLPDPGGRPTSVTVTRGSDRVVLDQPYAAARADGRALQPATVSADEVQARFGPTLAALPARAARFTLYFLEGRDVLTEESRQLMERSLAEVASRPVPDVLVVGHTDTVGSHPSNDALSRQRAEAIRAELVRLGVAPENVQVVGRGKREPAVPTADGVAEPRNRRVEIVVR
jgi:outer membrane protein OmpA-like peptidoglycan-associated protein